MKTISTGVIGVPVLVAVFGMMGGCATNADLQRIEKMAQEAKQSADQANANANKAMDTANAAKQAADASQQQAAAAMKCCLDNSEKMNRMFQKSIKK